MVGQWVCYNDEKDADRDALITAIHGEGSHPALDVVIVNERCVVETKTSVPHRSALLEVKVEQNEVKKKRGTVEIVEREVTRRKPGAFWRD